MSNKSTQEESLFPTRDTVQEVVQEGLAKLPISNPNELIALLQLHQNTVLSLAEKRL